MNMVGEIYCADPPLTEASDQVVTPIKLMIEQGVRPDILIGLYGDKRLSISFTLREIFGVYRATVRTNKHGDRYPLIRTIDADM